MISGIYIITNKKDDKSYIGSTVDFGRRWAEHRNELHRGDHGNIYLQRSWDKCGEDNFEFGILEYINNLEKLVAAEQFWMDVYREKGKELYNFGPAADNPMRGRSHIEEVRQKMSEDRTGEGNIMYGKHHSKETKQKISKTLTGRKASEETRQRMREAWVIRRQKGEIGQ